MGASGAQTVTDFPAFYHLFPHFGLLIHFVLLCFFTYGFQVALNCFSAADNCWIRQCQE